MANTNPTHSQTDQQQITGYIILRLSFEASQSVTRFQLIMLDGVDVILHPIPESNTNLIPHRARLNETWTQREYGLILESNRQLIPRGTWLNETPEQVQSHVAGFFRQLPPPLYPPPPTYLAPYPISWNQNIMVAQSASNSMPMIVNQTQQILTPVPMNAPFLLVSPYGEANSSTNESQIHMGGATASPSMNVIADADANANEEIDLELRLGRSQ